LTTINTPEIGYNPIDSVDQSDLKFVVSEDNATHIGLNWQLYIKRQQVGADGAELDNKDYIAGVNNFVTFPIQAVQYLSKQRFNNPIV
jgi:hypothetical protein